jgi:hypothetical protein
MEVPDYDDRCDPGSAGSVSCSSSSVQQSSHTIRTASSSSPGPLSSIKTARQFGYSLGVRSAPQSAQGVPAEVDLDGDSCVSRGSFISVDPIWRSDRGCRSSTHDRGDTSSFRSWSLIRVRAGFATATLTVHYISHRWFRSCSNRLSAQGIYVVVRNKDLYIPHRPEGTGSVRVSCLEKSRGSIKDRTRRLRLTRRRNC